MDQKVRARLILKILESKFKIPRVSEVADDPFRTLVRTVISQSTADVNTRRAYVNLSRRVELTPKGLAEADINEIEKALFTAGLYRNKSRILKRLAKTIIQDFGGTLDFIYSEPLADARRKLLSLPGVGPKTADIILLFCANRPVLPVDTHVNRVTKRLGFAPPDAGYEEVRMALQSLYSPQDYFKVHMLFISLGRSFCRARRPMHEECPVNNLCPSAHA